MKRFIYKLTFPLYQWYWKTFNPKTSGARALIIHDNQILLGKNLNRKYWSLPGGKIDRGETPEQCVLRELKEELDLDNLTIDFQLGIYNSKREGKRDTIYIFVIFVENLIFNKQWELEDAGWFPIDSLPSEVSPATKRRIREYSAGEKKVLSRW